MAKTTRLQADGDGRERAARRSAAEWAAEVATWRRSGATSRAYAESRGLCAGTLLWWSSRGSTPAASPPPKRTSRARTGGRAPILHGSPGFLPLQVVATAEDAPRVEAEIVLAGGRRVRVAGALTLTQLAQLLQVVEGGGVGC